MIRFIAALDEKLGIADEHGIPWHGKVPSDVHYYHAKVKNDVKLMGYGLYKELSKPLPEGINYVATRNRNEELKEGFKPVYDARAFLQKADSDVWNLGGALLFESTLDLADELYLTRLEDDFNCTKFFPKFDQDFQLASRSEPVIENGITYRFEVWKRKQL